MSPCGEYSDGNAQSVGSLPSMCSVLSKEGSVRGLGGSHPESDFENLLDVNELSLSDNLQEQLAEALQRRPPTNPTAQQFVYSASARREYGGGDGSMSRERESLHLVKVNVNISEYCF